MIFESSKGKVMAAWPPGASERINEVLMELVAELNLTSREWKKWGVKTGLGGPVTAHPSLLCQSQREG